MMIYFRGVFIGLAAVLVGTPIALIIWALLRSQRATVSFSPMGLATHLAHSVGFWVLIIVLFIAGFVTSVFFRRESADVA